ncbi:MAG: PFL family protein [Clostridiales bacterium]
MLNIQDILETIHMIDDEHLDIRTVTMGISLLNCTDSDIDKAVAKIYDKICRKAAHLVDEAEALAHKYGVPIINKRISVTPIALLAAALPEPKDLVKYALVLDKAAATCGVDFIGGYGALVHKGFSKAEKAFLLSIPEALAQTAKVCASVNIGSTKSGINMDAVALMGTVIKEAARLTAADNCIGAAKLVAFCNAVEDNPFMAGAFHGVGEADTCINIGVSGPGTVQAALARCPEADFSELADIIKRTAFKITRVGQLIGAEISRILDMPFGIVDLSLAPTPARGDSVARILEEMGLETCGACGTTAALALLNDAVKKGGVMASSRVGGLSGAFIPVTEDAGMIAAAKSGALTIEKLEAMTAVCSVGLDMIVIPGDTPDAVIAAIIADEAAIGMINNKTTAVRLIPAIGKKIGDELQFGGLLGGGPVMRVNTLSPVKFINRGGSIPAPIHSLKN